MRLDFLQRSAISIDVAICHHKQKPACYSSQLLQVLLILLLSSLLSCTKPEPMNPFDPAFSGMVFVQGGTFNPTSSYTVTLKSFYICNHEVTQNEYTSAMGSNPSWHVNNSSCPVEQVSWFSAIRYCNVRSMKEGFTQCYSYLNYGTNPDNWPPGWNTNYLNHTNVNCDWSANGYRLPTEMEWMFAARGGSKSQNYIYSGSNEINVVAWYMANAYIAGPAHPDYGTHDFGSKHPNELVTYDMSGNVGEWVWDIWSDSYPVGTQIDPTGPASGSHRVLRGGSWNDYASHCTVSSRMNNTALLISNTTGFRVCRSVQ